MATFGWRFEAVNPADVRTPFGPALATTVSLDFSRQIRRAVSTVTLLPSEQEKVDLVRDRVDLFLDVTDENGVTSAEPFGQFWFNESTRQCDVIKNDDGATTDLVFAAMGDAFVKLIQNDERARLLLSGSDPSQEMIRYLELAGVTHAIAGAVYQTEQDTTFAAFTTYEEIVSQLGDLAGHRRAWADNDGVIQSVSSAVVESEIIDLLDLVPELGTIALTENYLTAPNRVVAVDNQAFTPTVGVWNAPSVSPSSQFNRGRVLAVLHQQQGLSGQVHAERVAETVGERLVARKLDATIEPTVVLDGPAIIRYRDALFLLDNWSVSTAPGARMTITATELIL